MTSGNTDERVAGVPPVNDKEPTGSVDSVLPLHVVQLPENKLQTRARRNRNLCLLNCIFSGTLVIAIVVVALIVGLKYFSTNSWGFPSSESSVMAPESLSSPLFPNNKTAGPCANEAFYGNPDLFALQNQAFLISPFALDFSMNSLRPYCDAETQARIDEDYFHGKNINCGQFPEIVKNMVKDVNNSKATLYPALYYPKTYSPFEDPRTTPAKYASHYNRILSAKSFHADFFTPRHFEVPNGTLWMISHIHAGFTFNYSKLVTDGPFPFYGIAGNREVYYTKLQTTTKYCRTYRLFSVPLKEENFVFFVAYQILGNMRDFPKVDLQSLAQNVRQMEGSTDFRWLCLPQISQFNVVQDMSSYLKTMLGRNLTVPADKFSNTPNSTNIPVGEFYQATRFAMSYNGINTGFDFTARAFDNATDCKLLNQPFLYGVMYVGPTHQSIVYFGGYA